MSSCAWLIPSNIHTFTRTDLFSVRQEEEAPRDETNQPTVSRPSQLILTPYSSLVKVSFYLVSKISKLKVRKTLPNFGLVSNIRSSRSEVFCKKGVLRNFAKFTWKHLRHSLFFNKAAALRPATLLKKSIWHRCWAFCEISKNTCFYGAPLVAVSIIFCTDKYLSPTFLHWPPFLTDFHFANQNIC